MNSHSRCENNRTPLSLGENLCPSCANQGALAIRINTPAQKVSKAWGLAELALASRNHRTKQKSLEASSQLVDRAIAQKASSTTHAKARVLKGYLSALSDRAYHFPGIRGASKRLANETMGGLLLWRLETHIADNIGWSTEALTLYLMSREGVANEDFLFAASPREEANTKKRLNHDTYTLWPDGSGKPSKFPVQVKATEKQASQYDVPSIAIIPALRPVLNSLGTDSIEPLMSMAAFESIGKAGPYQETTLDFAGHCLQTAITTLLYRHIIEGMSGRG